MIQKKLNEAGYEIKNFKIIDTLQIVKKMRKEENETSKRNNLESLCKEFGITYGGQDGNKSHRGLEDSEATLDLLFYLINNKKIEIKIWFF